MIGISIGIDAGRATSVPPPAPASFAMTQLAQPNRVYQRDTLSGGGEDKGQGSIAVTLDVTEGGALYARCRSAADGSTIVQAPWLAIASVPAGKRTHVVAGVNARRGWFFLDLSGDGSNWVAGTTPVGMGVLGLLAGQSLASRLLRSYGDPTTIAGAGASIPADGRCFAVVDTQVAQGDAGIVPTAWEQPADAGALTGAGAAELLTRLIALAGVNVGLAAKTEGQTEIAQWQAGQPLGDALLATMAAAGGAFEFLIWYQGHGDTDKVFSYYQAQLSTLLAGLTAANAFAAPVRLIASIPNINSDDWGSTAGKEALRRASHDWAVAEGAIPVMMSDLQMGSDGVHPTQAGSVTQADHFYRALRPHFGASHGDDGAVLGVPAVGTDRRVITVPFTLAPGASALLTRGAPASRFKVYRRGDRSAALPLDAQAPLAIDNAARTITLRLADDPGLVPLDILPFGTRDPDNDGSASLIFDDLVDGDGLTRGRQLYPSVEPLRVTMAQDLVLTDPVYGPGRFGTTLTGGYGITPALVMPSMAEGYTLEAWMRVTVPDPSTAVFVGAQATAWIAAEGNDLKLQIGSGGVQSFAGLLDTNSWHHVAVVVEAPGLAYGVFFDGRQIASGAMTGYAATVRLGIRMFGGVDGYALTTQDVDEVALFRGARYLSDFAVPTAPYRGDEPGMVGLWHLNGNGADAAAG